MKINKAATEKQQLGMVWEAPAQSLQSLQSLPEARPGGVRLHAQKPSQVLEHCAALERHGQPQDREVCQARGRVTDYDNCRAQHSLEGLFRSTFQSRGAPGDS